MCVLGLTDELDVVVHLGHVPLLHQRQPVHRALPLWFGHGGLFMGDGLVGRWDGWYGVVRSWGVIIGDGLLIVSGEWYGVVVHG